MYQLGRCLRLAQLFGNHLGAEAITVDAFLSRVAAEAECHVTHAE